MTHPNSDFSRTGTAGDGATTTSIDAAQLRVVITVHRFAWSDMHAVRDEALGYLRTPGVVVILDLSAMGGPDVTALWVRSLVHTHRVARRSGSTLVTVGAPPRLADWLTRLRLPQHPS